MDKKDVLDFIKTKKHAVISTCSKNLRPEAALVGFGETDAFELIFGTYKTSKKYKNLKENNRTAFVIGWDEDYITVQYEGIARELEGEEIEKYVSFYFRKTPSASDFKADPNQSYWLVKPTWVRYSDLSGEEEIIHEFTF